METCMKSLILFLLCTLLIGCGKYTPEPGPAGAPGERGASGSNGANGSNGHDATPTYIVQFCAGYAPSYPRTFPEDGICIADKLYGVYSAPANVGLVELPPGAYTTTLTNAPCNFTVSSHCVVSQ
jgi:hypothetical protein